MNCIFKLLLYCLLNKFMHKLKETRSVVFLLCKCSLLPENPITIKPVLSGHSKIGKTNVIKTNGSVMKVESITKCSLEHSEMHLTCIKR